MKKNKFLAHYGTPHDGLIPHSGRYPWGSGEDPFQDEPGPSVNQPGSADPIAERLNPVPLMDMVNPSEPKNAIPLGLRNQSIPASPEASYRPRFANEEDFLKYVEDLEKSGMSTSDIAHDLDLPTTDFRDFRTIAVNNVRTKNIRLAGKMAESGMSLREIGRNLNAAPNTVRKWLNNETAARRTEENTEIIGILKEQMAGGAFIDVGEGSEARLGISPERLRSIVTRMRADGYTVHTFKQRQVGNKNETKMVVLAPEGTQWRDVMAQKDRIVPPQFSLNDTVEKIERPLAFPLSRIQIHWGDEVWKDGTTGTDRDSLIEIRPGVEGLSLGRANYAQVRINVEDKGYMKGMAVYNPNLPEGIDVVYHTNKVRGKAIFGKVFKPLKDNPENIFGTNIKMDNELVLTQNHYYDKNGVKRQGYLNIVAEEGAWFEWAKSLPSQVLSKQDPVLIHRQLDASYREAQKQAYKAMRLEHGPREKVLLDLAGQIDTKRINLKAAALPRQAIHVLLPCPDLKPDEIYAPNYRDGEIVSLVRYPHGGIFEIPTLKVNNHNAAARRMFGRDQNAFDAVVVHPDAAKRLSGADFDGDTAVVIPNNNGEIKTLPAIKELQNFDPGEEYPWDGPLTEAGGVLSKKAAGMEMGKITNLITDMSLAGASVDELVRATRHSMVAIDTVKHAYDIWESYKDNGIEELNIKYHGGPKRGAHTLISRTTSDEYVDECEEITDIKDVPESQLKDWYDGKILWKYTGKMITDKNGKPKKAQITMLKGMLHDPEELMSGDNIEVENIYLDYARKMLNLANDCRAQARKGEPYEKNPDAAKGYEAEIQSIMSKIADRREKSPLERRAQIIASADLKIRVNESPDLKTDLEGYKKVAADCVKRARTKVGAGNIDINLTENEWAAVFDRALGKDAYNYIMRHADPRELRDFVFNEKQQPANPFMQERVNKMVQSGYTRTQICGHLNISPRELNKYTEGGAR